MTDFQTSIKDRLAGLIQARKLSETKKQVTRRYHKGLVDPEWNDVTEVNDFQTAFLDLLNDELPALTAQFQKPLEERFMEMYSDSEDEDERNYRPGEELALHSIQLPSEESADWQLMYEMNSDETIFHVEFEGWTYRSIGITH